MHHHHTTNALFFAFGRVQQGVTLVEHAGVDPGKGQGANEGVVHDFERQTRERHVVVRTAGDVTGFGFITGFEAHVINNVQRAGQIVDHSVEQRLNAFVLEGGTAQNRNEGHFQCPFAQQFAQGWNVRLFAFQIGFHRVVVLLDGVLDHLGAPFVGQILQLITDRCFDPGCTKVFTLPQPLFHGNQVNQAFQLGFGTNREGNRNSSCTGTIFDHANAVEEVSADFVHLVDKNHTRNLVAVSLTPHGFGLGFNTGVGVQNTDSTIENRQRTLNFNGEVNVAGGVDDVQAVLGRVSSFTVFGAFPEGGGRSRSNGDTAFLLLLHPVHGGCTIVHLTNVVGLACVVQDALGAGGLTCIDVRHDAEVTVMVECILACHWSNVLWKLPTIVAERFVRFGHLVGVFALFNSSTTRLNSIHQLACQALFHGVLIALACCSDQPANGQCFATLRANFDGNLVRCTTHTAGAYFDRRFDVIKSFVEHFHRSALDLAFNAVKCVVNNFLCNRLFTVDHQVVHEFGQNAVTKLCVWQYFAFFSGVTT